MLLCNQFMDLNIYGPNIICLDIGYCFLQISLNLIYGFPFEPKCHFYPCLMLKYEVSNWPHQHQDHISASFDSIWHQAKTAVGEVSCQLMFVEWLNERTVWGLTNKVVCRNDSSLPLNECTLCVFYIPFLQICVLQKLWIHFNHGTFSCFLENFEQFSLFKEMGWVTVLIIII